MHPFKRKHEPRLLLKMIAVATLGTVCMTLPGCGVWNSWLDMWKFKSKDKADIPVPEEGNAANNKDARKLPALVVYRITLPVGTFSANPKGWQSLNEDVLEATTSNLLVHNGFRAGVGNLKDWPAIYQQINVPGSATEQTVCQTVGRASFSVTTRTSIPSEVVVSLDKQLDQQGRTFAQCDDGFRLNFTTLRANGTPAHNLTGKDKYGDFHVLVEFEPVVAEGVVDVVRKGNGLGIRQEAFNSTANFTDLQLGVSIRTDQFLILSPLNVKENPFSVGSQWLSDSLKSPATETLLVFVPTPPNSPTVTGK